MKLDNLQDNYWKINSDEAEGWKTNLENEEDAAEDIVTEHVKEEESEYSSLQQGEPNGDTYPRCKPGKHKMTDQA